MWGFAMQMLSNRETWLLRADGALEMGSFNKIAYLM